ncbi:hypothetical protein ABMA28_010035 [Loxostege sticticalis]|uniref:Reverse transcriptase domain-containing protein n=1 Tax=Loxostege sticticalis TaxID=481309 RepID=A0ABD0SAH8_LOXSC
MNNSTLITQLFDCSSPIDFYKKLPANCHLNLTCLHLNIRSMIKNFTTFLQLIHSCPFPIDIIALTEVGISERIAPLYNIPTYNMHIQLRNNRRGGGIILYVKNHIKFTENKRKTCTYENITGILKINHSQDVGVCVVYRPPKTNQTIFVKELGSHILKHNTNKNFLLVGDINIDLKTISSNRDLYLNTLSECGLTCGVSEYTRIEKRLDKVTKTCIDHIFARFSAGQPFSSVLNVTLADHRAVVFACTGSSTPSPPAHSQDVHKEIIDHVTLCAELKKIKWSSTHNMQCPNQIYDYIRRSINDACKTATKNKINKCFKCFKSKLNIPWIDDNINKLCEKRNQLFRSWKNNPNNLDLRLQYTRSRNKIHKIIENRRNEYYLNLISDNFKNSKKVYQIVNQMLGRVTVSIDSAILKAFDCQGLSIRNIAENFALNFDKAVKDIIPKCSKKLLEPESYLVPSDSSIRFKKASCDSILKIIKSLNPNKAPGMDNIKISLLKIISNEISGAIANLINTSVSRGLYPDELKIGCVRPVHKKGPKNDYMNYRPITLLSSIDKVVEKYLSEEIHSYYKKQEIITKNQYGFQSGKSATELLSKFTDEINTHLNERKHVLVLFIDFSRAFDTLDHKELVKRLDRTGVRGPLLQWCDNYLRNRRFTVRVGETYSNFKEVTEGTAQGSVLDDTCLIAADKDPQKASERLQLDFDWLTRWCHDAGLVLNADKTQLLCVKSPHLKFSPYTSIVAHCHCCLHMRNVQKCNCPEIKIVESQRYLGLVIDSKLNWSLHIEHVCDKLRQFLANMIILKNQVPYKIRLLLYNSLVESHIQYGLSSYGRTYKTYLQNIFNLQRRILRNIVSPNIKQQFYNDDNGLFNYCKILPVHIRIKQLLLKENFFNKHLTNKIEHPVFTRAIARNLLSTWTGASVNNIYGERTTAYLVPRLMNELPPELRDYNIVKPCNINRKLKTHYLNRLVDVV